MIGKQMTKWKKDKAISWYEDQPWLVGCNFLPSSAINQLEMFQDETFDAELIRKEVGWAARNVLAELKPSGVLSKDAIIQLLIWLTKTVATIDQKVVNWC